MVGSTAKDVVRTTCPRDCYDSCGIAVVRRNGALAKVLGDPEHRISRGALCGKCAIAYNGAWRDPAARLAQPLRRIGAKGEGRFAPIPWDEAFGEIAARLKPIVEESGGEAVLSTHYTGTCSLIANNFPNRFFNRLGATDVEPDTVCNNAGHEALNYTYGTSLAGFDPRTARDARCIVVWGCNPSASAPHAHRHWLPDSPARKVVIDPVRHDTAKAADLHLQLFPGSDAALAFAMLHILHRDGLADRDFIAKHTVGWDELEPFLASCTPTWGEAQTGVPAHQIDEAARLYGTGPSLLWIGQGLQRQPQGGNITRACALLPAVTGNIGKPGAGIYYLNGKAATRNFDMAGLQGAKLRRKPVAPISHMELASRLSDVHRSRALFCWNMNIAASAPNQARLLQALRRDDLLTVVVDLFQTDTADYADFILPAASFLEFDDLVASYFHLSVAAQVKASEPMGDALPNAEIFRQLARAMGFADPELFESDDALIGYQLGRALPGVSFAELAAKGTIDISQEPVIIHADLRFPTPSGKIEIASERAAADGFPRVAQPVSDARPVDGRLRLLSPASAWLMNSSYGNDRTIMAKLGPARVALHPTDAAARGLKEGQNVLLRNDTGQIEMQLAISDVIPRGAALTHKTPWLKRSQGINVNALNPGLTSDMGRSTALHGVEIEVLPL
jgi:anaerobic selenocysteine-containing dehydrogenase